MWLHVFASSSDRFVELFASVVIGQSFSFSLFGRHSCENHSKHKREINAVNSLKEKTSYYMGNMGGCSRASFILERVLRIVYSMTKVLLNYYFSSVFITLKLA